MKSKGYVTESLKTEISGHLNMINELRKDKKDLKHEIKLLKKKVRKHKYRYKTLNKVLNDQNALKIIPTWANTSIENKENHLINSRMQFCSSAQSINRNLKSNMIGTTDHYLHNPEVMNENSFTRISRKPSRILSADKDNFMSRENKFHSQSIEVEDPSQSISRDYSRVDYPGDAMKQTIEPDNFNRTFENNRESGELGYYLDFKRNEANHRRSLSKDKAPLAYSLNKLRDKNIRPERPAQIEAYKEIDSRTIPTFHPRDYSNKENNMRPLYKGSREHMERTPISDITNQIQNNDLSNYIDKPLNLALDNQKYIYEKDANQSLSELDIESQNSDNSYPRNEHWKLQSNYGKFILFIFSFKKPDSQDGKDKSDHNQR